MEHCPGSPHSWSSFLPQAPVQISPAPRSPPPTTSPKEGPSPSCSLSLHSVFAVLCILWNHLVYIFSLFVLSPLLLCEHHTTLSVLFIAHLRSLAQCLAYRSFQQILTEQMDESGREPGSLYTLKEVLGGQPCQCTGEELKAQVCNSAHVDWVLVCCQLAVWPWESFLASLCLCLSICKKAAVVHISQGCLRN